MNYFNFQKYEHVKVESDGRKVLALNINPEKACIFNCKICNAGKTKYQGEWHDFGPVGDSIHELVVKIEEEKPDIVEIAAGKGDVLTNPKLEQVITAIHERGIAVRVITNCYLLGIGEHMRLASMCEEVVAGFCFTEEDTFQEIHRPRQEDHLTSAAQKESMIRFSHQFKGLFTLRVLLVKGYNDSDDQVMEIKKVVDQISYDKLWVTSWPRYNVEEERVERIMQMLQA